MAKQEVVLKLSMEDAKKSAKAMQCAVGMHGVLSVSHEGDKLTVVGEGIDSVKLTRLLRKKMGHVKLEGVTSVEEKKEEVKKVEEKKDEVKKVEEKKEEGVKVEAPVICPYCYVGSITQPHCCFVVAIEPTYDQHNCSIM